MRARCTCWLAVALALVTGTVRADEDSRARALELGRDAMNWYDQHRWADAYQRFEQAEALVHSPVFLLYMARSKSRVGELVAARRIYERASTHAGEPDEPDAWRQARSDAGAELGQLIQRIPTVRVSVVSRGPAKVWLDGAPLSPERVGQAIDVDPGEHQAVARMASGDVVRESAAVREGQRDVLIELVWPPRPKLAPATPTPPAARGPDVGPATGSVQRQAGAWLMVLGGLGLLAGSGTGLAAIAKDAELAADCPDGSCPSSLEPDVRKYYALAHATTALLAVGGTLLLGGIIVHVTAPSAEPSPAPGTPAAATTARRGSADRATAAVVVAPGFAGMVGSF